MPNPRFGCGNADYEAGGTARAMRRSDFSSRELREAVFLNCVGTFGVISAGYWWGRAGGAIVRLSDYLIDLVDALWVLLNTDDGWTNGRDEHYERGLILHLLVLSVLAAPLAEHKVRGGIQCEWSCYLPGVSRFQLDL